MNDFSKLNNETDTDFTFMTYEHAHLGKNYFVVNGSKNYLKSG